MLSADANTSQQNQSQDFIGGLVNWWKTSPLFTRSIMFLSTGICILSLISHIEKYLINVPEKTIGEFQITRLIFSPFTFESIAELLFGLLAYLPLCAEQEKQWGTLKTLVDFFIKNLEINLFFIFNCWVLSFISDWFWGLSSYGLWGIFFVYLIEKYFENPDGVTLFLSSPFQIPTKYYPFALFVLFTVITEAFRFDIIVAALIGLLHHRFLNMHYNELLSDRKLATWEASSTVTWLKTIPRYTSPGSMPGALMDSYDQHGHGTSRGFGSPTYGHPNPNAHESGYGGPNTSKDFNQDVEDLISDAEQQK